MKQFFLLVILMCIPVGLFAETAILPYEIIHPSKRLPEKTGKEYARILYVAAKLNKNITLTSPDTIDVDIERMKFGRVITKDELELLGKTRHVDYMLAGSLTRSGSRYISKSRLYSAHDGRVVVESTVSATDLFSLAENEIREVFASFEKKGPPSGESAIDLVFLIDCAYNLKSDWADIKSGIVTLTRRLTDSLSMDAAIYGIPFSSSTGPEKIFNTKNSLHNLQKGLDEIKPAGKGSNEFFERAIKYALLNVQWRDNTEKAIIIISNGDYENSIELESYAYRASRSGVQIFSVLGANVTDKTLNVMRSICDVTEGDTFSITYHKDIITARGEKGHLFLERGRLFYSAFSRPDWRRGIIKKDRNNPSFERASELYTEIINTHEQGFVKPETMVSVYQSRGGEPVLKEGSPESSMETIFDSVPGYIQKKHAASKRLLARVLVSDGSASVWITVYDKALLKYFAEPERKKYYFSLGLSLHDDSKETYGVRFVPRLYDIRQVDVPESLAVKLEMMLSQKDRYMDTGLSVPPLWFVSVRVERIHYGTEKRRDVRLP